MIYQLEGIQEIISYIMMIKNTTSKAKIKTDVEDNSRICITNL